MRTFDYSFLNNGLLPANLINLTTNIATLKTMAGMRKDDNINVFTALEAVAKVQSVKSSNAIEAVSYTHLDVYKRQDRYTIHQITIKNNEVFL